MEGIPFDMGSIVKAGLVFMRVTSLLFALPFFGDQVVSPQVRILMGAALAACIFPVLPAAWLPMGFNAGGLELLMMVLREVLIGLVLGYLGRLLFEGLVMAASLVGYQMGFGTASLMMPGSDTELTAFTALHRTVVLLIFLSLSLHYIFIHALMETFRAIPAGGGSMQAMVGERLIALTAMLFTTAMQLSGPILVALLFTMAALGVVARTVPQLNVFTLSFPFSFFVGLIIYVAMTPLLPSWLQDYYLHHAKAILTTIPGLAP